MITCLGKSCSFGLLRKPFVNCCQFMYLVLSLLVLKAEYWICLYHFLIIAYRFYFFFIFILSVKVLWSKRLNKHFCWLYKQHFDQSEPSSVYLVTFTRKASMNPKFFIYLKTEKKVGSLLPFHPPFYIIQKLYSAWYTVGTLSVSSVAEITRATEKDVESVQLNNKKKYNI